MDAWDLMVREPVGSWFGIDFVNVHNSYHGNRESRLLCTHYNTIPNSTEDVLDTASRKGIMEDTVRMTRAI